MKATRVVAVHCPPLAGGVLGMAWLAEQALEKRYISRIGNSNQLRRDALPGRLYLRAYLKSAEGLTGKPEPQNPPIDKAAFIKSAQKLQLPFIANNGQVDEQVRFYAKTFGGTVFVTKDGEIVYFLAGWPL